MEEQETYTSAIERAENRNLAVLSIQNVVLRVGWIFKTESVIIPHVMDLISGSAGWARGCLPILSRVGQSVPALIYADRLRSHSRKKFPLFVTAAFGMAGPFLLLSAIWFALSDRSVWWMTPVFLTLYFIFFSATGLNQLTFGTLQGKLIRPNRRGLLLGIGGIAGSIAAVSAAWFLLRDWVTAENGDGFAYIFLFNGMAFLVAGIVALFCDEPPDETNGLKTLDFVAPFKNAIRIYREDKTFRRAATVAMLFISSLLVFPHYQSLGREEIGTTESDLIVWVIVQNICVGIYSPVLGRVADQFGNRLAIRIGLFAVSITPLVALLFASGFVPNAARWYWITFALLGLTPVLMRTILNYTLELTDPDQHSQYLSTMKICFAAPFVFSPLVGALIDWIPYQIPFAMVSCLVFAGAMMTFRMSEPRHQDSQASS